MTKEIQMADESLEAAGAETAPAKDGTLTVERFEALQRELFASKNAYEEIRKALTASDQKVTKLVTDLEQKEKGKLTYEDRIATIEKRAQEAEAKAQRQEWLNAGYKLASERNLPPYLVDNYGGPSEGLKDFLDLEHKRAEDISADTAKRLMSQLGHKPGTGIPAPGAPDYKAMSPSERMKAAVAEAEKRLGTAKN